MSNNLQDLYVLKQDLISDPKTYTIQELGKNIGSTLNYYEREKIIPKPFKISLGRKRGTVSAYFKDIIPILHSIIKWKEEGFDLNEIQGTLINFFSEYYLFLDLITISDIYLTDNFNTQYSYLADLGKKRKLKKFQDWLKSKLNIILESTRVSPSEILFGVVAVTLIKRENKREEEKIEDSLWQWKIVSDLFIRLNRMDKIITSYKKGKR